MPVVPIRQVSAMSPFRTCHEPIHGGADETSLFHTVLKGDMALTWLVHQLCELIPPGLKTITPNNADAPSPVRPWVGKQSGFAPASKFCSGKYVAGMPGKVNCLPFPVGVPGH
jgi:hypothetical protein